MKIYEMEIHKRILSEDISAASEGFLIPKHEWVNRERLVLAPLKEGIWA
jgi:hypothetical protein